MRGTVRLLIGTSLALFVSSAAQAAEIKVLIAGALQVAVRNLAADYEKRSGDKVTITSVNPSLIAKEMSEHDYDVLGAATVSMAEFSELGNIDTASRKRLVRTGIGIAIKEGAATPDLSTVVAFKKAVMAAKNVVYTDPSLPNTSGAVTQHILTNAGLLDAVKAKGKQEPLAQGRELVAKGEYEIGFFNVSEAVAPGVVLAGPVPAPLQQYTDYDVAKINHAPNPKGAAAFETFITAKAAGARWKAAGLERLAAR